jgi:hypothetical protein
MKRRNFLQKIAGIVGVTVVGTKVAPAPALDSLDILAPLETAPLATFPRGLAYVVNNGTTFIGLSRASYSDLSAPTPDVHGGSLTFDKFEQVAKMLKGHKKDV